MGRLVPLPPWATEEQKRARDRYYTLITVLMISAVVGVLIVVIMLLIHFAHSL